MLTARLNDDELERLERRIALDVAHLVPGTVRSTREVAGIPDEVVVPDRAELREAADDLLAAVRAGVNIAPQAESRPLVPLYEAQGQAIPAEVRVDREQMGYEYYLVELTFSAMLPEDQQPLNAEFALRLNDDVDDAKRKLRPTQLFPARENVELFRVDLEGAFGLDADMKIKIPEAAGVLLPFAKLDAAAKLKAGIVAGPYTFPFRKAKIEVTGLSDQDVRWRYNMQSALWGTNVFKSVLVLKIAREAKRADVRAALSVVPFKTKWAIFKERLPALTAESTNDIELVQIAAEAGG